MIVRLYNLLNEDVKSTLFNNLIDPDTDYYASILRLLITKTKFLSERLKHKIEDLPKAFLDLQEHPSTYNWKRIVRRYTRYINKLIRLLLLQEIFIINYIII